MGEEHQRVEKQEKLKLVLMKLKMEGRFPIEAKGKEPRSESQEAVRNREGIEVELLGPS